jgi:proteasome lid subunit RPN8/RPN11
MSGAAPEVARGQAQGRRPGTPAGDAAGSEVDTDDIPDVAPDAFTVRLSRADYDRIVAHCEAGLPNEACGLIAGRVEGRVKTVERVYPCANVDRSSEHFTIDPHEQLAAIRDARAAGLSMLGNFHSHPQTPARQSVEDKRLSYDHAASYLILSLAADEPVLNSFRYDGVASTREVLVVE